MSNFSLFYEVNLMLFKRNSIYYAVINIPKSLVPIYHRKQIWQSLHTKDRRIASLRVELETMAIRQRILNDLENLKHIQKTATPKTPPKPEPPIICREVEYTEEEAELHAYDWLMQKSHTESRRLLNGANRMEERKYFQNLLSAYEYKYLQRNYQDIYAETNNYFQEKQLATPTKTCAEMIFNAFMRAKIQLLRYLIEFLNGYCGEIDASLIDRMYFKQLDISAELKQKKQHKPDMSLMQVVKHYNQTVSRNKTSDATKERVASKMELIAEIIGKNKPIRQITADDLNDVIQNIPYIPKRFGEGVTKGKTIIQAINMAKHNKAPTLSEKTQTDYIHTLSSIFKWAKQKKFIEENPMEEVEIPSITVNRNQDKYLPFSINQLNIIFHSMVYRGCLNNRLGRFKVGDKIYRDGFYWVPLIALFSGMRLNEICQLTTADIITKDEVICFSINDKNGKRVKTANAIRIIPIHPTLIKCGFLQYVEQQKNDITNKTQRIFPELVPNCRGELSASVSKFFNRLLDKLNETIDNDDDKFLPKHVAHSFRHTFRSELRNHQVPHERVVILGGWDQGSSLASHYGSISAKELYKTVSENLTFDGLDLSHLYV